MSKDTKNILIGIAIAVVVAALIPATYYDSKPASGHYVNEGIITEYDAENVVIQLFEASTDQNMELTENYLILSGESPDYIYQGQKVIVSYSFDGAIASKGHGVELCFQKKGSVLGLLLKQIEPFHKINDYKLVDLSLNGPLLSYNVAR